MLALCLTLCLASCVIAEPGFLLIGGNGYQPSPNASTFMEKYHPEKPELNAFVQMPLISYDASIASGVLNDGNDIVIIAGGADQSYTDHRAMNMQILIPSRRVVMKGPDMTEHRNWPIGIEQINNVLYICGGLSDKGFSSTCERFTWARKWEKIPSPIQNTRNRGYDVMVATKNYLYIIHNFDGGMERFSPITNSWSMMSTPPIIHFQYVGATSIDQHIFVCGGSFLNNGTGDISNQCYRYSESENLWETIAPMMDGQAGFVMLPFDNKLFAIGGKIKSSPNHKSKKVYVYDLANNSWSKRKEELLQERMYHTGVVLQH